MSESNRIIRFTALATVLAVTTLFVAWSCQPQYLGETEAPSAERQSRSEYDGANGSRSVTCHQDCQVHFGPRENPKPEENNDGAGNSRSESNGPQYTREGLDLLAQRRMAYWAIWLAGFTFVGIVLLAGTFWEAMEATKAANAAANAADKTTNETRRIGEAQTRAYLSITGGEAELDRSLPMTLTIRMNVHNTGNSPAGDVVIFAEACFEDRQEPGGIYRFDAGKLEVDEVGGNISYPRELVISEFDIGKLDPLLDNQGDIGIHGRIEYRHVFMSSEDKPIVATFALSGHVDEKRSKWGKEVVTTQLNTCRHSRWKNQDA